MSLVEVVETKFLRKRVEFVLQLSFDAVGDILEKRHYRIA
jgi:hypothetical protein